MKLQVRFPSGHLWPASNSDPSLPVSLTSIFHVETPMQIPVFCLITPTIPSLSSGSTSRRTGTSSRCSAQLSCSCCSPLNRCVRVCSPSKIRSSSARVSRLMTHGGARAVLMPCVDIGVPRFGVVGLNNQYTVRTEFATRPPVATELTGFLRPSRDLRPLQE